MTGKRLLHTLRISLCRGGKARVDYMRKHHIFASIGENCTIQKRKPPLYPELIRIGNNVHIASGVSFLTHDITHNVLNNLDEVKRKGKVQERVGCIDIRDNVFIGAGTRILYDTKIGPNVIVATGSIITKDVPPGSVVAGVPAKVIGTFDDYVRKMTEAERYPEEWKPKKQEVCPELVEYMWKRFDEKHGA